MKLKNFFMYAATATTVLSGCSENKPILNEEEEPATPATLSIRIDADGTVISKAETDQTVANMYVLIFNADGSYYKAEALGTEDTGGEGAAENVDIVVKEGNHQVLVIANFKGEASALAGKSLSQVQAMTTKLDMEADGNLTMSSEVMAVTFLAAVNNMIGYGNSLPANSRNAYPAIREQPVKLYRSVARVQLSQLILDKENIEEAVYGSPQAFCLQSIFIANAKGYSQLASTINEEDDDKYLSIEAATAPAEGKLWWYGDHAGYLATDVLKKTGEGETYQWSEGLLHNTGGIILDVVRGFSHPATVEANPVPIGKYFYIYENEEADPGEQTLLILKGDYSYRSNQGPIPGTNSEEGRDVNGEIVPGIWTATDRYYAIPINTAGMNATPDGKVLREHEGVIRNTIYDLRVTITGPGSTYPYQPEAHLYYNAKVVVADWTRVNIGTPEDPEEIN